MSYSNFSLLFIVVLTFLSCQGNANPVNQTKESHLEEELSGSYTQDSVLQKDIVSDLVKETLVDEPTLGGISKEGKSEEVIHKENRETTQAEPPAKDATQQVKEAGNDSMDKLSVEIPENAVERTNIEIVPTDATASPEVAPTEVASLDVAQEFKLHKLWNDILQSHVTANGAVDYDGIRKEEDKLDEYLNDLGSVQPGRNDTSDESLAYWINAYNAFTIKLILNHYPVNSITDIDGGNPWDSKWIKLFDKTYSLNQIEHEIIRPRYKDARIHFAVNCAAKSCPKLANEAFTKDNLQVMLDKYTRAFVNNKANNLITAKQAKLSKIFDWYGEDFGDLRKFLNQYSTTKLDKEANISFKEYDWSLNKA